MATPYFLRKAAPGRTLCRQVHPAKTCRRNAYVVKLLIQASSQAQMGGGVRSVLSFLNLAWCGLLYFCRRFVLFKILHKVKDKNLSGQLSAVSTNSIPGPAFARHCAWRRVVHYLLFAAFGAITTTTAWAAQAQSNVEVLLEQARSEEKTGDYAAAERIYKHVLANDPQYPEVNFFLGVSYLGKNDFNESIDSFESELKTPNPHPRSHYYLGLAFQSSGRIEEATSQLNQSLVQNTKDADALYELARIYKNASLRSIELLKTLDEDSFQLHALMGEVYADEE